MIKKTVLLLFLVLMSLTVACGGAYGEPEGAAAPAPALEAADRDFSGETGEAAFAANSTAGTTSTDIPSATSVQRRLIIRTGELSIVVEDTEETLAEITRLAEASGGWVVSSSLRQYSDVLKTGDITLRVPAQGFSVAVDAIKAMALEVTSESTSGQDVTDEFVDLSSRLENLEATAARVRGFLDSARNVEEALAVNRELSRLEEEIEVIKGRMQYLEQSADFSTLHVRVVPDELSQPFEVGGWRPEGIARDAIDALIGALQGLAGILIWLGILILPLLLLLGVPLWLLVRLVRRRRRHNREVPAPSES